MHVFGPVVAAREHVAVGLEFLGLGQPPCGYPYEGVPPQGGFHGFHDDPLEGVAVGYVARFVGQDRPHFRGGGCGPYVDRAEERERSDLLPRAHDPVFARAGDLRAAPQVPDTEYLPQHDAENQGCTCQVKPQAQMPGRDGVRLGVGQHFGRPVSEVGRSYGRGRHDDLPRPYGDA